MEIPPDIAAFADLKNEVLQMLERRQKMLDASKVRLRASAQLIQSSRELIEHLKSKPAFRRTKDQ